MQVKKIYDKQEGQYAQARQESSSPQSQAKKVSWIVALIIIIISVFIAIICSAIYAQQPDLPIEYDYVISNWQTAPIFSITPSASGCNEYFTNYQFPGTVDGCDCTSSSSIKFSNQIFGSQCSEEQLSNNCKSVNSTPQTTFTKWQLQSQILQLCVTRITGFNYMQSDCQTVGYQRCGVAQGDTTNPNMFCLPASTQCPINSIIYAATAPDTSYVSIINVGTQKIFTSNSVVNSQPLASSHISRGNGECKNFLNKHFIDPNMKEYELMRGIQNTCTYSDTDSRFRSLFQITESTYLNANNYDVSNLPKYPLSQNMQYYFLTRSYIPWQQLGDCRYTHMPYFIDLKSNLDKISNLWIGCIVINWVVAVFYGGLASALRLKLTWKIKNWFIIPTIIILLVQTIMTVLTFAYAVYNNNKISNMKDAECSDAQTNSMISSFSTDFNNNVLTYQIVLLVFVLVLNIFTIFFMKTIFLIIRNSDGKEVIILPQQTTQKINYSNNRESSNRNKKNAAEYSPDRYNENHLLEDKGQLAGGFDNTYQPNSNADANTMQYQHIDGGSDAASNMNSNNLNANANTINQETINVPLVVKVNEDSEGNKQKSVLKKGGQQQQGKNVQIIQPNHNQSGGLNVKITKYDNNSNKQNVSSKDQELETLYQQISNTDLSGNRSNGNNNNNNNNNQQNKQTNMKINLDIPAINNNKNTSNNNINSRNNLDMQLNVLAGSPSQLYKFQNNESHFTPEPAKPKQPSSTQIAYQEQQDLQAIQSLANMDGLLDKEDWEFEIDDYVKKHRENQQSHSRIGGGFEIGKPREKYLGHKFKKSQTRRLNQESSMDFDLDQANQRKTQQNLMQSQGVINQATQNQITNNGIVEDLEDYDNDQQSNLQKLP